MFVIVCKESGCVKLTSSQDPRQAFVLASDLDLHFDVLEFPDDTNYNGKFLKVVDNKLIDMGTVADLEASGQMSVMDCNDCPPFIA